ncbi:hypothetical protein V1512DRAFT_262882 [Lipomyces arxii]|uniref:uncharacterized protein n=1 Tax=Lipomyces arxii TaxID=56418 RepID=UPI0034CDBE06
MEQRRHPNRSPSILVTDSRANSGSSNPGSSGSRQNGQRHNQYSNISVSNLLFNHGTSDIASARERRRQSPDSSQNFAPYSSFDRSISHTQYRRDLRQAEELPLQTNHKPRDPRLVVADRSNDLAHRRRQRRRQEYTSHLRPVAEYRDEQDESGSDDDERDDLYKFDKIIYLPVTPTKDVSAGQSTGPGGTSEMRRVTAYLTADTYSLGKINAFLIRNHNVNETRVFAAGSPDAALYVPYWLPLVPGRAGCRIRSGRLQSEEDVSLIDKSDDSGDEYSGYLQKAELFIFAYGVMVFWNFTETQERDVLADITFADSDARLNMVQHLIPETDRETEEFRFEYSRTSKSPQISNDVITLRANGGVPGVKHKLTMSHAIAQSTKLSFFETQMENITMMEMEPMPKQLALHGSLGTIKREDIMKIEGRLFTLRVDVNLSSSVLDIPEFFWEEEPEMHAFYMAIREYLELKQRVKVLNQRVKVFLDLADILADSIAETNMSRITWVIILLIILSLMVTTLEIFMRFSVLSHIRHPEL